MAMHHKSNLRAAPLFLRPSVVRALIEDTHLIARAVAHVPVLPIRLVDQPRAVPLAVRAVPENNEVEASVEMSIDSDEPARVAPVQAEDAAPVCRIDGENPAPADWPDAPLPEHADPDLDRPAAPAPDQEPWFAPDNAIGQVVPSDRDIFFPIPGQPIRADNGRAFAEKQIVARRDYAPYRGQRMSDLLALEAAADASKADRKALIREAAARLHERQKAEAKPLPGARTAPAPIAIPPLPTELRRRALAEAIAFLKCRAILVSVNDREAMVRKYRVSGRAESKFAEEVIEIARSLGMGGDQA